MGFYDDPIRQAFLSSDCVVDAKVDNTLSWQEYFNDVIGSSSDVAGIEERIVGTHQLTLTPRVIETCLHRNIWLVGRGRMINIRYKNFPQDLPATEKSTQQRTSRKQLTLHITA